MNVGGGEKPQPGAGASEASDPGTFFLASPASLGDPLLSPRDGGGVFPGGGSRPLWTKGGSTGPFLEKKVGGLVFPPPPIPSRQSGVR